MKEKICIGVSAADYDEINITATLTDSARQKIEQFLVNCPYKRLLVFGASITGRAVRTQIGSRFAGFIDSTNVSLSEETEGDCVVIATAPVHVPVVEEVLAASPLSGLPVVRLFVENGLDIRLILETQPRSGTGYTIGNLQRTLGVGFASTFRVDGGETTPDGRIMYVPENCRGYVVKTHFTKPLHYPQYRYCPTLFLLGYFPDTYYRWARMISGTDERDDYRLRSESKEWNVLRGYIPLHVQWLDYIRNKDFIRYEDYYSNFDGVMDILERLLGERPQGFEVPRTIKTRIYQSGEYGALMDNTVRAALRHAFRDPIRIYYPEMAGLC